MIGRHWLRLRSVHAPERYWPDALAFVLDEIFPALVVEPYLAIELEGLARRAFPRKLPYPCLVVLGPRGWADVIQARAQAGCHKASSQTSQFTGR
jgi:hypothetical protein